MTTTEDKPRRRAGGKAGDAAATDRQLRDQLLWLLGSGGAHVDFDAAVKGLPAALRGQAPRGMPHSPWQLIEHIRIAQWDIVEFSRDARHVSPAWPEGYWPPHAAPPSEAAWRRSIKGFRDDLDAMRALVADPKTDLFAPIPWGDGQTVLREALLVADHNAYHLGQLVIVRRLLGAWPSA
jgi:hypothetical protein